jgi:hypothetical protein
LVKIGRRSGWVVDDMLSGGELGGSGRIAPVTVVAMRVKTGAAILIAAINTEIKMRVAKFQVAIET